MMFIADILMMAGGVIIALVGERIIRHICRRICEEDTRINLAAAALDEQKSDLEYILSDETVDTDIKKFALNVSESILDRKMALEYASLVERDWNEDETFDEKEEAEIDSFIEKIRDLAIKNKLAFEKLTSIMRRAVVAAVMQWSDTSKRSLAKASLKMASETPMQAAHSMAVLRSEAQHHPALNSRTRHAYV